MTKTALGLLAGMILILNAPAQNYTGQHIGNFDYWSGPNGYYGTGQRIGNFYYWNDSYGYGTGQRIGNQSYFNYNRYNHFWDQDDD
jgi:hypothetical protein